MNPDCVNLNPTGLAPDGTVAEAQDPNIEDLTVTA